MDDYISRQVAIDALDGLCDIVCQYSKKQRSVMCGACPLGSAFDTIAELPSADAVEVRHGKWVHCDDGSLSWRCSVCGKHAYGNYAEVFSGEYHFCPNCGARMDGEI